MDLGEMEKKNGDHFTISKNFYIFSHERKQTGNNELVAKYLSR